MQEIIDFQLCMYSVPLTLYSYHKKQQTQSLFLVHMTGFCLFFFGGGSSMILFVKPSQLAEATKPLPAWILTGYWLLLRRASCCGFLVILKVAGVWCHLTMNCATDLMKMTLSCSWSTSVGISAFGSYLVKWKESRKPMLITIQITKTRCVPSSCN